MEIIFEVIDKTKRKIHLSNERWKHIRKKHPEVEDIEQIEQTVKNPNKIVNSKFDETISYYYKFFKDRRPLEQFLLVIVKYLNGEGFVATAYFEKYIRK